MKKTIITLSAVLPLVAMVLPMAALAQIPTPPVSLPATSPVDNLSGIGLFICTALNWVFYFLVIFAVVFILLAAFKYLTAAGDPEKVKAAGQQILYAAIAVGVALIAKAVPLLVGSLMGATLSGC